MAGVNKATLVGNVGKDPEIRSTRAGERIANFSLATSESWRDRTTGERKERTQWHTIVVFNKGLVELVEKYVRKGDRIYLEGAIETRKWTGNDGQDRYTTEIVLRPFRSEMVLLSDRRAAPSPPRDDEGEDDYNAGYYGTGSAGAGSRPRTPVGADIDDEIPF